MNLEDKTKGFEESALTEKKKTELIEVFQEAHKSLYADLTSMCTYEKFSLIAEATGYFSKDGYIPIQVLKKINTFVDAAYEESREALDE